MIYMIIVDLHLTVDLFHVMASMGCLGLLEEVSYQLQLQLYFIRLLVTIDWPAK